MDVRVARVINGEVIEYPYLLRPDARRLYPDISPVPADWAGVEVAGMMGQFDAVVVHLVPRPDVSILTHTVTEEQPAWVDGVLTQQWRVDEITGVPRIMQDIQILEGQITQRRLREAVLSQEGKDWLEAKEAQIAALREQLND